jgi:acyl transferase domain-containing protein
MNTHPPQGQPDGDGSNNASGSAAAPAVAVIGCACAFPGIEDFAALWPVLSEGRETIRHFTDKELLAAGVHPDRLRAPNYVKSKGVLEGVEYFDHELFGIEADRALLMDPQHRVFIQKCWEALEDSGYDPRRCEAPIALFAGCALNTYMLNNLRHADPKLSRRFSSIEYLLMTDKDFLTTQTSYLLGLTGPSVTVQSACSTSLSAIHYACESLFSGESAMALAGAVTVYAPQVKGYLYEPDSIISPDGHVRSFDARGGGTVYSSGVAVVVLKLLQDALADGDQIYAVIRSTALNNDGGRKAAFKMPSVEGIADVAREALSLAQVPADSIGMIEANGSGTAFGDPIEVEALARAYGANGVPRQSIPIGSVKSNIGHMNVTAGMGAFMKTVASLREGQVPPSVNFETPNPKIRFEDSPFYVCTRTMPWPVQGQPRRAAVNVYGVGGTNGHAILEQAPDTARPVSRRTRHLLTLSAATPQALERARQRLAAHLARHPALDAGDVAWTLNQGRQQLPHRAAAVVEPDSGSLERVAFDIAAVAPSRPLGTCLVFQPGLRRDPEQVFAAAGACVDFDRQLQSVLAVMPEVTAWHDQWLRDGHVAISAAQSSSLKLMLSLAVNIVSGRLLLEAGLVPSLVHGGGDALAALAVAGVLPLDAAAELQRAITAAGEGEAQSALNRAMEGRTLGLPAHDLNDPVRGTLLPRGRPVGAEEVVAMLLVPGTDTGLARLRDELACTFLVVGDAQAIAAFSPMPMGAWDGKEPLAARCLRDVAAVWTLGGGMDLGAYYADQPRGRVSLPTYPFEKVRHWIDIPVDTAASNYDVAL